MADAPGKKPDSSAGDPPARASAPASDEPRITGNELSENSSAPGNQPLGQLLAGKWQFPALILSLILLLSGLPLLRVKTPAMVLGDQLAAARQAIADNKPADALAILDRLNTAQMPASDQADRLLLRGRAHFELARAMHDPTRRAKIARQAAADFTSAAQLAGGVGAISPTQISTIEFLVSRGRAQLWSSEPDALSRGEADLLDAESRLTPAQDEQRKEIIVLLRNVNPQSANALMERMLARTDLSPANRVWVIRQQARQLGESGRLEQAVNLIDRSVPAMPPGSAQDGLEIELARLYYETAIDRLHPAPPDQAARYLDQAALLLSAVELRRLPIIGEEELDAELHWLLGEVSFLQDRPDEAGRHYRAVVDMNVPTSHTRACRLGLAKAAALYKQFDLAHETYLVVVDELKTRPDDPLIDRVSLRKNLVDISDQLRRQERWEVAYRFLVLLYQLIDADSKDKPTQPDVKEMEAVVLRALAGEERRAAQRIEDVLSEGHVPTTQPEEIERLRTSARNHLCMAAEAFLDAADLTIKETVRSGGDLEQGAMCYDEAGETGMAIKVLKQFVEHYPADKRRLAQAVFNLGKAYQAAGRYTDAIEQYQKMLDNYANSPDANKSMVPIAQCYKAQGQFKDAESMLLAVLQNDAVFTPESTEYCEALFELAKLKYECNQYRAAIGRFDEFIQRRGNDPATVYARYYLADCYRASGRELASAITVAGTPAERQSLQDTRSQWLRQARLLFDQVITLLEARAVERKKLDELDSLYLRNAYFFRADCLFDLGEYADAVWLYDLAALKFSNQPEAVAAYVQIVNCYQRMGKPDQARTANERAKWLLKRVPPGNFNGRPLPLDKDYVSGWLEWTANKGL